MTKCPKVIREQSGGNKGLGIEGQLTVKRELESL